MSPQAGDDGLARLFGLLRAVAEILAWAFIDHDDGDGAQRVAVLAGQRRVGKRKHDQRKRQRANGGAAAARGEHQEREDDGYADRGPQQMDGNQRSERNTEIHSSLSYWPSRSSSAGT